MNTIILKKPGEFALIQRGEIGACKTGEVTIKIQRVGICGTDYHAFRGNQPFFSYPRILGHELGGELVAIGGSQANSAFKIGDRVAVEPYLNCGECQSCQNAKGNCCEKLQVLGVHTDGGMTEYLTVPGNKVHVSNKLEFDQLALIEMLGIGSHAVTRAAINRTESVLINGAGPIGLAIAQFCKIRGTAKVIMADFSENRLKFASQNQLCDKVIIVKGALSESTLREQLAGDLPEIVFDATGNKDSMHNCFNITAHGGKVVFVGLFQGDVTFNDPNFHRRELTVLASRNALPNDFKQIIKYIEEGSINTTPWLTHRVNFQNLPETFPLWLKPDSGVVKAIVEF